MPPAFALSQDQTLRFIQASPCNQSHTATPKRTSKGSSLSPNTSQPTPNNQAPSHNTQNKHPKRNTHPGADRASHPATHRNKAKTHRNKAQHPTIQRQPSTINFQKNQMQLSNNKKKNQQQNAIRHPTSPAPIHTNHRQGKQTSQNKPASQPKKPTTSR